METAATFRTSELLAYAQSRFTPIIIRIYERSEWPAIDKVPKSPSSILRGLYVSRIPPFFREMPDRFTRVITRFRRFSANRTTLLEPSFPSPSYFHYSLSTPISPPPPPNVFSRSLPEFFVSSSSDKCSIRYFSDNAFDRGGSIFLESNLDR